jgi:hypothetical protein
LSFACAASLGLGLFSGWCWRIKIRDPNGNWYGFVEERETWRATMIDHVSMRRSVWGNQSRPARGADGGAKCKAMPSDGGGRNRRRRLQWFNWRRTVKHVAVHNLVRHGELAG